MDGLRESSNVFFAVRIDGRFDRMKVRVMCRTAPGVRLVDATANQVEKELGPISGTLVGFWSPPYASGLEVAGYHLHFLTDDRRAGGHVLDCAGRELRTQIQMEGSVHVGPARQSRFPQRQPGRRPNGRPRPSRALRGVRVRGSGPS